MNLSPSVKTQIENLLTERVQGDDHLRDDYTDVPGVSGWPKVGAFGRVYRMLRMEDWQEVAVKVIELNFLTDFRDRKLSKRSRSVSSDSELTFDFLMACQEAVLQSDESFQHPKIVKCHASWIQPPTNSTAWQDEVDIDLLIDFVNDGELTVPIRNCLRAAKGTKVYIIMDLYQMNLEDLYKEATLPDRDVTLSIFSQIAEAVAFVHEQNYVHRDIKPKNILIRRIDDSEQMEAALGDFGLCRSFEGGLTLQGRAGTPPYNTAPEPFGNTKYDMWALGILMFEILYTSSEQSPNSEQVGRAISELVKCAITGDQAKLKQFVGQKVGVRAMKKLIVECLQKEHYKRISAKSVCEKECMKRCLP